MWGVTKSATHSHRSKGEIAGICILVIYILFKTVHILKRKRKLKPRFWKEHRQFVRNVWLHASLEGKKCIFSLLSDRHPSKTYPRGWESSAGWLAAVVLGCWFFGTDPRMSLNVIDQKVHLCRVQWDKNTVPNQIGWPILILASCFLKL